ncbi:hypothetical protein K7X08_037391 [Anisodus acutangulus]|uniref:AAA+ ATPase At3g28540-like C-terminal domain-containing protein n=1 Tax=Anisodus acutangulus TaxID=402998 RepID=A0A9Q1RS66_9SOLA|nr:hypothetical protein K7X08_037391 [Anisodus acutangulus]
MSMERNAEVTDYYKGHKFKWILACKQVQSSRDSFYNPRDMNSTLRSEVRSYELSFHRKNKDLVLKCYLPYIINEAKLQKLETRTLKIHTVDHEMMHGLSEVWTPVNLDHLATFETLAMDLEQKDKILKDLDRFVKRKNYYRKVGKAWKRGYLLYGPPGRGKSSLIAAMDNYLNFDIYDLELTEDEWHIHMAYCTPCGFRLLASNYLGITEHQLFEEIENLIRITVVTPAEVAEQLMKVDEIDIALEGLIYFLHMKKKEYEVSKIEEEENE